MTDLYNIEGKITPRKYCGKISIQEPETLREEAESELKYFLDIYFN